LTKKLVIKKFPTLHLVLANLKVQKHANGYDDANGETEAENTAHQAVQGECDNWA
jgi:hypothetical protein